MKFNVMLLVFVLAFLGAGVALMILGAQAEDMLLFGAGTGLVGTATGLAVKTNGLLSPASPPS